MIYIYMETLSVLPVWTLSKTWWPASFVKDNFVVLYTQDPRSFYGSILRVFKNQIAHFLELIPAISSVSTKQAVYIYCLILNFKSTVKRLDILRFLSW